MTDDVTVHHGDALDVLAGMPDASVDAVVTDPPYGLEFMGKDWDGPQNWTSRDPADTARSELRGQTANPYVAARLESYRAGRPFQQWCEAWAAECLRLLKPGGHLLAFGGTRTFHRLACAIEDAGFEIRDCISWLYGSGFPKSLNVGAAIMKSAGLDPIEDEWTPEAEQWRGHGSALKPAWEPVIVARKPLAGTVAGNVLAHGTGALNIAATRIPHVDGADLATSKAKNPGRTDTVTSDTYGADRPQQSVNDAGRWPANVVLDEDAAAQLDRQSGDVKAGGSKDNNGRTNWAGTGQSRTSVRSDTHESYGDFGGASRFYYTAKAAPDERPRVNGIAHPTCKPVALMRWLVRLVTPPGGLVLDPFAGSGTTGEACIIEGFRCVLIEREAEYLPLIEARLSKPIQPTLGGTA